MNRANDIPYLRLLRLPNSFTAVSNVLAAQLLATQGKLDIGVLILLASVSTCLYTGGVVLNDCFDLEEDRRERPDRPLPAGEVPVEAAWILGAALLIVATALAALVSGRALVVAVTLALLILLYDGYAKRTAGGAFVMGACRYGNWMLGLSVGGTGFLALLIPLPVLLYVTALTLLSKAETTAAERTPLILCATGLGLTALLILLFNRAGLLPHTWALLPLVVGAAIVAWRLTATFRRFTPAQIQMTIKTLVIGIILLDAILVWAGGPWWGGIAVAALLAPSVWLARHLYVT
jgi:4-hydroxybenzoate polyprenyltransferase